MGGGQTRHTLRTLNGALLTWGYQPAGKAGIKMGALAPTDEMSRFRPEAAGIADRLWRTVSQSRALRPSFLSLMAFKIQQQAWRHEPPGTVDCGYWKNKGWLEPACAFYLPHRTNRGKAAASRLAGAILARWMI